jgi:hypothetical protein
MKPIEPKYLGVDAAEARYGLSKWTLRRMAYDSQIGSVKVGKRLLLSVDELDRLFAAGYRPALTEAQRGA